MATDVQTPVLNITKERSTFALVQSTKLNSEGKEETVVQFMTENAAKKAEEKQEGTIVAVQSFLVPNAATAEGIAEIVPSEKERTKLFNRGVDAKAYQLMRGKMLEQDKEGNYVFQPVEGDLDLSPEIAEESASRATSPEAKLEKIVEGLDEATAAAVLAKLLAKLQGQAPAAQ